MTGRGPTLLALFALLAAGCAQPAQPADTAGLPDLRGQPPGDYLEPAADVARLAAFLREPPLHAIDCGGSSAAVKASPVEADTALLSELANWFVACVAPIVGGVYTEEHPDQVAADVRAAQGEGSPDALRALYERYAANATAALSGLLARLDRAPGSVVDAEVLALAMRRASGLASVVGRGGPSWQAYAANPDTDALERLLRDQSFSTLDARSIAAVLDAYPWSAGRCSLPDAAATAPVLEHRLDAALAAGRAAPGTADAYGRPLETLDLRTRALLDLSAGRGWGAGLLEVEMTVAWAEASWPHYGQNVTAGEAATAMAYVLATGRSLELEDQAWHLRALLEDPESFALNPTAGPRFLGLVGLENPFLALRCSA